MNRHSLNYIHSERLKEVAPKEWAACYDLLNQPVPDFKLIPLALHELLDRYERIPENYHTITAILFKIFVPYKLQYPEIRLFNGIRSMIAKALRFNHLTQVNEYTAMIPVYWQRPNWRAEVTAVAEEIAEITNKESKQ